MYERESLASTKVLALAVYGGLWFMVYGLWSAIEASAEGRIS